MTETIELIVKVKIADKSGRKEAIEHAKKCVTCTSWLGTIMCTPKSAKLHIS